MRRHVWALSINNDGGRLDHVGNTIELLGRLGLKYLWEVPDIVVPQGLNMFRPYTPQVRVTLFYPAPAIGQADDQRPWLFRSTWLFLPRKIFS